MKKVIDKLWEMDIICSKQDDCKKCEINKICDQYCGDNCPSVTIEILENVKKLKEITLKEFLKNEWFRFKDGLF